MFSQAFFTGIQGGDPLVGFASGALSSVASSLYGGSGYTKEGKFVQQTRGLNGIIGGGDIGMVAFGTVMGGAGATLTGGNFWQGAATGLVVSGLNHLAHKVGGDPKPKSKNLKQPKPEEILRKINEGLPYGETATLIAADGIKNAGLLETINETISSYKAIKYTHVILSNTGKVLGVIGYGGAGITTFLDFRQMQSEKISATRFSYRTAGTLTSITTSIVVGTQLGGPLGAFGGLIIGTGFSAGEMLYDAWHNTIVPQFTRTANAFENGWRPTR